MFTTVFSPSFSYLRTIMPSAASRSFNAEISTSPKWKMDAASPASISGISEQRYKILDTACTARCNHRHIHQSADLLQQL